VWHLLLVACSGPHDANGPFGGSEPSDGWLLSFDLPGREVTLSDLAVASDGALCAVGSSFPTGHEYASDVLVIRIDPEGQLDSDFGDDGSIEVDRAQNEIASAVATGVEGACLVAGHESVEDFYDFVPFVVEYARRGEVVASFGRVSLDLEPEEETTIDVAATASGGAVVLRGGRAGASVVRVRPDGTLDPAWGVGGVAALPVELDCVGTSFCSYGTVAELADETVLAVVGHPAQVVHLDATGVPDPTYGVDGVAASSGSFRVRAAHVAADGHCWLGGSTSDDDGYVAWAERMDASGGATPPVSVLLDGRGLDLLDLAEDAVGRLVLAGRSHELDWTGRPALVRIDAEGNLDPTFEEAGQYEVGPATGSSADFTSVEIGADGTVSAIGHHAGTGELLAVQASGD
jgi:uncharacterized delta-60 repeat protein